MINFYTKLPLPIQAVQFTKDNVDEVKLFTNGAFKYDNVYDSYYIQTLEGQMKCEPNCYIVKGIKDDFYPIPEDTFKNSYRLAGCSKEIIPFINATPDIEYPIRILNEYRNLCNTKISSTSDGMGEPNALYAMMNQHQIERAEILDRARKILLENMK